MYLYFYYDYLLIIYLLFSISSIIFLENLQSAPSNGQNCSTVSQFGTSPNLMEKQHKLSISNSTYKSYECRLAETVF